MSPSYSFSCVMYFVFTNELRWILNIGCVAYLFWNKVQVHENLLSPSPRAAVPPCGWTCGSMQRCSVPHVHEELFVVNRWLCSYKLDLIIEPQQNIYRWKVKLPAPGWLMYLNTWAQRQISCKNHFSKTQMLWLCSFIENSMNPFK